MVGITDDGWALYGNSGLTAVASKPTTSSSCTLNCPLAQPGLTLAAAEVIGGGINTATNIVDGRRVTWCGGCKAPAEVTQNPGDWIISFEGPNKIMPSPETQTDGTAVNGDQIRVQPVVASRPVIVAKSEEDAVVYAGGSPNFDEGTGTYKNTVPTGNGETVMEDVKTPTPEKSLGTEKNSTTAQKTEAQSDYTHIAIGGIVLVAIVGSIAYGIRTIIRK